MKRYIVFERPVGSACWTLAHNDKQMVRSFHKRELAEAFAAEVEATHRGWLHGVPDQTAMTATIAEFDLPE